MKDYLPLDAYILVEGSISISNGPAGPSSGGSIYQIRKITNAVRLYYYDGLTHSYTYFQADDGGGGFGYEGANFIMVVW